MKYGKWSSGFATAVALVLLLGGNPNYVRGAESTRPAALPAQTDVDRAKHLVDDKGVPLLTIAGIGDQRHPAGVAIYALAYAGVETYDPKLAGLENTEKFNACITWLERNLKQQPNGLWVWEYGFDSTYNDISIKAPWSSAFAQAAGIQALLTAHKRSANNKYLELANKAAQSLFTPLAKGGFLFQSDGDIWFEEIPQPVDNPGHILNGHMRVLLALKELADASGEAATANWLKRGTDTLHRWLPRYDTGYWLRYDLNPQKKDLLFRFANPYGFPSHPLAIDKISLRDPVSKKEVILDVGAQGDAEGANRIAGIHWGQIESLAGKTVRRLTPAALESKVDEMGAPHSYFYLALPSEWKDNLRDEWFELVIEYYDDAPGNITIQQRAVSPGPTFRDMRDGDLHLTGAGQWRKWIVPLRPTDLGYWVGLSYADKHRRYIEQIAKSDKRFSAWSRISTSYANMAEVQSILMVEVNAKTLTLPKQTPMTPVYSLDRLGVVRQHAPDDQTKLNKLHMFDATSSEGVPVYSPFVISSQLLEGENYSVAIENGALYSKIHKKSIRREPALNWLLNAENYRSVGNAAIYTYPFQNAYNDVATKPNWSSAFGQAYVLKALIYASEHGFANTPGLTDAIRKTSNAFAVSVASGGVSTLDRSGNIWYEEVPNATHVLNAHLITTPELSTAARFLQDQSVQSMANAGIQSLRNKLHLFDTGYWLRYDQNPKKELLLQLDWLAGNDSPLIDEVLLQNPQTGRFVRVDVGQAGDFDGGSRVSGSEWRTEQVIDGKNVRSFVNGYRQHSQPVPGGSRHNVFLVLNLPEREFSDFFDVPVHRLVVRYKDVAVGTFGVKIQSISEGQATKFVPLRDGILRTNGDQQWKEAFFSIRPQDLGWYKGPDYQAYEVEQLRRIASQTGDWFFSQHADRHGYFLEEQKAVRSTIIEPVNTSAKPVPKMVVTKESPTYPGHGFSNALDGEPNNDYVAGIENEQESVVEISLEPATAPTELRISWESAANFAKSVKVYGIADKSEDQMLIGEAFTLDKQITQIPLSVKTEIKKIKISFSKFSGQPRLLLRLLEIK